MKIAISIIFFNIYLISFSQGMSREEYVIKYYKLAIQEMNLYKIPASITLAQAILETGGGQSRLAKEANNHFGIKCQNNWTGPTILHDDDAKGECFRVYSSVEESYRDHSLFLTKRERYQKLFTYDIKDYKSWAYGLKEAGYATNPKYPLILIKHIEELKLYEYDNYGEAPPPSNTLDSNAIIKVGKTKSSDSSITTIGILNPTNKIDSATMPEKPNENFIFNNLKRVIIDKDFDIEELAKKNNLTKRELMIFNECETEQDLKIGQNFFLQRKLEKGNVALHEAKPGESIYDISQIYGIRVEAIRKFNKLEVWEQPMPGEAVFLSNKRNSYMKTRTYFELQKEREQLLFEKWKKDQKYNIATQNISKPNSNVPNESINTTENPTKIIHIVKAKETIFSLAKKYGTTPAMIDQWNEINDKPLQVGQRLTIFLE